MQELNQGEEYEEYGFQEENDELEFSESDEDTTAGIDTIFGMPKQMVFLGGAIAVVVLLLILMVALRLNKKEDVVLPEDSEISTDYAETETTEEYYDESEYMTADEIVTTTTTEVYLADGSILGTADATYTGADIYDSEYKVVGTFADTGTEVYDSYGNIIGYVTLNEEETVEITPDTEILRKLGYTGDEIELALSNGASVDELVAAAEALRDEEAKEALIRMSDTASDEFKLITNDSIFCMPYQEFVPIGEESMSYTNYSDYYIVNADYEKLPSYGLQLIIKCKIANGTYVFMTVEPTRWQTLPDTGNIVLGVTYILYGDNGINNLYISKIEEVDITKLTVNPQDSGVNLEDVINKKVSN